MSDDAMNETALTDRLDAALRDPLAVYHNMLRGTIAKPDIRQIIHLYGITAFREAMGENPMAQMDVADAYLEGKEEGLKQAGLNPYADNDSDDEGRISESRIRELLAIKPYTEGPWKIHEGRHGVTDYWIMHGPGGPWESEVFDCSNVDYEGGGTPPSDADAAFIIAGHDMQSALAQVVSERDEAHSERLEQARLLGMSAERELALISERDRMLVALDRISLMAAEIANDLVGQVDGAKIAPVHEIRETAHNALRNVPKES